MEDYELRREAKELVKSEDAVRGLVVGNTVYDPLLFSPEIVHFSAKQYKFLHAFRLGVTVCEAAQKAGLSEESAERFLDKPSTIAWLKDRALKDHIKKEWEEPSKWWATGQEFLDKENLPKHKLEVWKEFGDRVCPKVSRNANTEAGTHIEINIDPDSIQRSKERRASIEAQIVKDDHVA